MITVLRKADVVENRYLRLCDTEDVRAVLALIKEKKTMLRNRHGESKDEGIRALGDIPREIYFHPALRRIFHNKDPEKGAELKKRFLNERTAFRLVDYKV